MNNNIYISYNKILSYPFLFAFIMTDRGDGKTYGFKQWAINDYLKNGNQFVYLRRYKSELSDCDKFFVDIQHKYPDYEFTNQGRTFYIKHEEWDKKKPIGYAITLSTGITKKSVSYEEVNKICFDEFVVPKSHIRYLPDEVFMFLELYETIARMREVKVVFLANRISEINPYTLYFNIKMNGKIYDYDSKKGILVATPKSESYRKQKRDTRFAKLIQNTDYYNYAFNDDFYADKDTMIASRTPQSKLILILKYNNKYIGLWNDKYTHVYYFSYKINEDCLVKLSILMEEMDEEYSYIGRSGWGVNLLKRIFKGCTYRYDNIEIKSLMFDVMKKINI